MWEARDYVYPLGPGALIDPSLQPSLLPLECPKASFLFEFRPSLLDFSHIVFHPLCSDSGLFPRYGVAHLIRRGFRHSMGCLVVRDGYLPSLDGLASSLPLFPACAAWLS